MIFNIISLKNPTIALNIKNKDSLKISSFWYKISKNLNHSLLLVFKELKKIKEQKKVILFSPSAASFDQFKNFEHRGNYFNKIINKYLKK